MRRAKTLVPTFGNSRFAVGDHAADHRIRLDEALATTGKLDRPSHVRFINGERHQTLPFPLGEGCPID